MRPVLIMAFAAGFLMPVCRSLAQGATPAIVPAARGTRGLPATFDTLRLLDSARGRAVPLAIYAKALSAKQLKKPGQRRRLVILNHGYGGRNTGYSSIAGALAAKGYFVVSIQHELPDDAPVPTTGSLYETRKPFWERGVQNILFTIKELKRRQPGLDYSNIILIGHSMGGDMVMLFGEEHPDSIAAIISLDNRRVAFPRTARPRIFSLRSSDQPADAGVLPGTEEQVLYRMHIVSLPHTIHNDMADNGTAEQRAEINRYIGIFLGEL